MTINDQPLHRNQRHSKRSRKSSAQSRAQEQPASDLQSGSPTNAAGAVLGSSSNISINGGNFTAAANVKHVTINIGDDAIPQPQVRETRSRGRHRRKDWMRPQQHPTVPAQRSNEIYVQHLKEKQRGQPLWIPQANMVLPIPYRTQGIRIGDVGLYTENGGFDFLFNICVPRDDPINPPVLPDNFIPLSPFVNPTDIRKFPEFSPGTFLASSSVAESRTAERSSGLTFESSASEGAILTMPEGAYSEDLCNVSSFRQYITTHAEDWYRFVNGPRGREARNGDLHVVVGSDKTTSWGMATFQAANSTLSQDTSFQLKFSAEHPFHWNGKNNYAWEHSGVAAEVRVGPGRGENQELGEMDSNRLRNQCLFVRTLNVELTEKAWEEIFPQAIAVTDENNYHPGIHNQPVTSKYSHGSSAGYARARSAQFQNIPSRSCSSTDEETSGSANEEVQYDSTPTPNVILTPWSSSNDVVHPSKLINQYLLKQNPHARVAVTHDRDWSSVQGHLNSSQMLSEVLSMNDIVLDNDTGLVHLELKEINHQKGTLAEEARLSELIATIKNGKLNLDEYLFGTSRGDHCLCLQDLCTALRSGSRNNQPISKSSLIGHPERPLSLNDILKICNEGSIERQPILKLRAELNLLHPSQHADRSNCLLRLADALSRRFVQWDQRDDLEEAIWCYEEALSLLPNSHYQYLETLLSLSSSIYQRFYLLGHAEDLKNLLRYLGLEHDVLNQRGSLVTPVEAQLKKLQSNFVSTEGLWSDTDSDCVFHKMNHSEPGGRKENANRNYAVENSGTNCTSVLSLPDTLIHEVSLYVLAHTFLGPPRALLDLALPCHTLNRVITDTFKDFEDKIFSFKFDIGAIIRTLFHPRNGDPADAFRRCCNLLEEIRRADNVEHNPSVDDILIRVTASLPMLNNYSKTYSQLEHAGLDSHVGMIVRAGFCVENWSLSNFDNSVALWLMWTLILTKRFLFFDYTMLILLLERLVAESPAALEQMIHFTLLHVGYRETTGNTGAGLCRIVTRDWDTGSPKRVANEAGLGEESIQVDQPQPFALRRLIKDEANFWVKFLSLFHPPRLLHKFEASSCDFNHLAVLSGLLPRYEKKIDPSWHLQIIQDLMNFYLAFDDYMDVANKTEATNIGNDVQRYQFWNSGKIKILRAMCNTMGKPIIFDPNGYGKKIGPPTPSEKSPTPDQGSNIYAKL